MSSGELNEHSAKARANRTARKEGEAKEHPAAVRRHGVRDDPPGRRRGARPAGHLAVVVRRRRRAGAVDLGPGRGHPLSRARRQSRAGGYRRARLCARLCDRHPFAPAAVHREHAQRGPAGARQAVGQSPVALGAAVGGGVRRQSRRHFRHRAHLAQARNHDAREHRRDVGGLAQGARTNRLDGADPRDPRRLLHRLDRVDAAKLEGLRDLHHRRFRLADRRRRLFSRRGRLGRGVPADHPWRARFLGRADYYPAAGARRQRDRRHGPVRVPRLGPDRGRRS